MGDEAGFREAPLPNHTRMLHNVLDHCATCDEQDTLGRLIEGAVALSLDSENRERQVVRDAETFLCRLFTARSLPKGLG